MCAMRFVNLSKINPENWKRSWRILVSWKKNLLMVTKRYGRLVYDINSVCNDYLVFISFRLKCMCCSWFSIIHPSDLHTIFVINIYVSLNTKKFAFVMNYSIKVLEYNCVNCNIHPHPLRSNTYFSHLSLAQNRQAKT